MEVLHPTKASQTNNDKLKLNYIQRLFKISFEKSIINQKHFQKSMSH